MMFINGRNHTWFARSWTLVVSLSEIIEKCSLTCIKNIHELACVSGIAAAYRLGADYVKFDDLAENFFSKYLLLTHGVRYKGGKKSNKAVRGVRKVVRWAVAMMQQGRW
jgi:hypothetical protein